MKQEQLKKLAEWYGLKFITHVNGYEYKGVPAYNTGEGQYLNLAIWQPHKDSNQLDMLEDKMIEECEFIRMRLFIDKQPNGKTYYQAQHFHYKPGCLYLIGDGKTKNEARLNAILNYIEKK